MTEQQDSGEDKDPPPTGWITFDHAYGPAAPGYPQQPYGGPYGAPAEGAIRRFFKRLFRTK
ncbi:hypothetical protein [Nocardia sp. NPDC050793]|uniref:hypothetical protein n=1 Tax=Nocardia sp. NPDC050793 TaxID=3155159 RepID=UPI0033F112BD